MSGAKGKDSKMGMSPSIVGEYMRIPFMSLKASTIDGARSTIHAVDADLIGCQSYNGAILHMRSVHRCVLSLLESIGEHP